MFLQKSILFIWLVILVLNHPFRNRIDWKYQFSGYFGIFHIDSLSFLYNFSYQIRMNDTPQDFQQTLTNLMRSKQQLLSQKHYQKAYHTFKAYLKLKKKLNQFLTTKEFISACELSNLVAMRALKSNHYSMTVDYLKQASHYSKYSSYMLSVTHSNWGCYYKKVHNYELALQNSLKALTIAKKLEETQLKCESRDYFVADCHLNICAILSSMKKHELALQHAKESCKLLQQQSKDKHRKQVYWIGFFNLAVEYQHLKRYQQSMNTYMKLRSMILDSDQQNCSLLGMINQAISSLQKIVLPRKLNSLNSTNLNKSSSIDPLHRFNKISVNNLYDDHKSSISVSKHHHNSSYHIHSAELSKLPMLSQNQNTTKTIDMDRRSSKKLKLQSIGNTRSLQQNLINKICPTDRIIFNKKRKINQENMAPQ